MSIEVTHDYINTSLPAAPTELGWLHRLWLGLSLGRVKKVLQIADGPLKCKRAIFIAIRLLCVQLVHGICNSRRLVHVGFTIQGILCQVHDHMYCWEPLFPWYCADTESLRFRIRHNLGWVRKVTCQRSLELGFQKVTLEFLGLIRKISHLPLGRSTCFEGYLWMWPRLEEHDYVSFIGKGSGLNIVCIYPTSYILTQPNSRILIFWRICPWAHS